MRSVLARPAVSRLVRGPGVSLASQGTGVLQLGLLLAHGGATNATDVYFYLFSLGLTPILILGPGLMYPLLLNADKITQRGLRRVRIAAPVLAAAAIGLGCTWLARQDRLMPDLVPLVCLMAFNGALQGKLYFRAIAAEAGGNPLWISGVALPANLAACVVLAFPWSTSTAAVTAMVGGLIVGNGVFLAVANRRHVGRDILAAAPDEAANRAGALWFLGRASVGYVAQLVLSSLAVLLPASGVTLLGLASKLVGATSTTFTNALMPSFVHQKTETPDAARRFLRWLLAALAALGVVGVAATYLLRHADTLGATVVALWVLTSSAAAIAGRMSYLFLRAAAAGATLAILAVVVGLAVGASRSSEFSLTVLLCAYAALDGATAALLLWALKDRQMSLVMSATLLALGVIAGCALVRG